MAQDGTLTSAQVEAFHEQGFLILENFASQEEVVALKARAEEIVHGFQIDDGKPSVFSTVNQKFRTDNQFLDSANGISVFLEEKALGPDGKLDKPKELAVNKIGHAMHDLDPVFKQFCRSESIQQLYRSLGFQRPLPVQSMSIFKQPRIGGEVRAHQDGTFLWTDPPSVVGVWVAVEDATKDNGCLWTLPGSHKGGVSRRFKRKDDDSVWFDGEDPEHDLQTFIPLEMKAGSLVVLHGANVHFSCENTSPHSRHAFSMHVVEGAADHVYSPENWLQRSPDFPFVPLY